MDVTKLLSIIEQAKQDEDKARARRIEAERELVKVVENRDEGTVNFVAKDERKVRITYKLNRSILEDNWAEIEHEIIPEFPELVQWKPSLNLKLFRSLETKRPDVYRRACYAIKATPAKPHISIERE